MKWFHHETSARDDDKIFELLDRQGLQGYGFFWVILEECYKADDSGFQILVSETWCKRISRALNLTDFRTIYRLLDTMAEVGLIDRQLWHEKTIYVPGIQQRADSYIKNRTQAAERKRKQRKKERLEKQNPVNVTQESRVTGCDIGDVTHADPDLQNSEPQNFKNLNPDPSYTHSASEGAKRANASEEVIEGEILEEEPNPIPVNSSASDSPKRQKDASSAKLSRKKKTDYEAFRQVYNANKPGLWSECEKLSAARQAAIDTLVVDMGEEDALLRFEQALRFAQIEKWWNSRALGFDALMRKTKGHVLDLSERFRASERLGHKTPTELKQDYLHSQYQDFKRRAQEVIERERAEKAARGADR